MMQIGGQPPRGSGKKAIYPHVKNFHKFEINFD